MSSTIEISKTCEWCGNTFIARKCTTRYCSKRCAEHAYKDAKRKEHVAKEQSKANSPKTVESSPFLSPGQCARLLGVSRRSIYNYLATNSISCYQFKGKTLISRESLNALFDGSHPYQLRPAKEKQPITEFYTTKEVLEKFGISNSWLFKAAKAYALLGKHRTAATRYPNTKTAACLRRVCNNLYDYTYHPVILPPAMRPSKL